MNAKKEAAIKAVKYVKDGMKLGLGTGSTVYYFIEEIGKLIEQGYKLTCVSTSNKTTEHAKSLGIDIVDINDVDSLDLVVDGADEIDPNRNGVKGGGGALFRERVVANLSKSCIWIADSDKMVKELGGFKLPVEIVKFGYKHTINAINKLGYLGKIRENGGDKYITDNENYIYDLSMEMGYDPYKVYKDLKGLTGVVEIGLFLDICDIVCVGEKMENIIKSTASVESWDTAMFFYQSTLKQIETKIDLIRAEFKYMYNYNPIEHIKTRVKTPESIMRKLKKLGHEVTLENMIKYIDDIAGIRIICSFVSDIYKIYRMIMQQDDIKIIQVKDYISEPKNNGYKSLHIIIKVPIYLTDGVIETKVEMQLRTIAMDFWASLEHKIHYKFDGKAPDNIVEDLKECADMISKLDDRMLSLNRKVQTVNEKRNVKFEIIKN